MLSCSVKAKACRVTDREQQLTTEILTLKHSVASCVLTATVTVQVMMASKNEKIGIVGT